LECATGVHSPKHFGGKAKLHFGRRRQIKMHRGNFYLEVEYSAAWLGAGRLWASSVAFAKQARSILLSLFGRVKPPSFSWQL
jgi:hypothetical protein